MLENGFVITGWKHYDPEVGGIAPGISHSG